MIKKSCHNRLIQDIFIFLSLLMFLSVDSYGAEKKIKIRSKITVSKTIKSHSWEEVVFKELIKKIQSREKNRAVKQKTEKIPVIKNVKKKVIRAKVKKKVEQEAIEPVKKEIFPKIIEKVSKEGREVEKETPKTEREEKEPKKIDPPPKIEKELETKEEVDSSLTKEQIRKRHEQELKNLWEKRKKQKLRK